MLYLIEEINPTTGETVFAYVSERIPGPPLIAIIECGNRVMISEFLQPASFSRQICELSSGTSNYYHNPHAWYCALADVLAPLILEPMPPIHTSAGHAHVKIKNFGETIYFTWYRMPSGNYEIICYLT